MKGTGSAVAAAALALACTARRPASLGEALAVEQEGGTVSQLVARGSELPTNATESFTTSRDGETRLFVHVLRGGGKDAGKLKTDSFWQIDGVQPAKAGTPKVMLTFELDAQGKLSLSAREGERRLEVKQAPAPAAGTPLAPLSEPDDAGDADEADDEAE